MVGLETAAVTTETVWFTSRLSSVSYLYSFKEQASNLFRQDNVWLTVSLLLGVPSLDLTSSGDSHKACQNITQLRWFDSKQTLSYEKINFQETSSFLFSYRNDSNICECWVHVCDIIIPPLGCHWIIRSDVITDIFKSDITIDII